ncbi:MAG TPA: thioester reductase domain-containing protein [Labilithrix sp.]|nr:thioester reductase domain-containing protein [Labilithrix sp.]
MGNSDLPAETYSDGSTASDAALLERARTRARDLITNEPELRRTLPPEEAIRAIERCPTSIELVAKAFELYADRVCLRERSCEIAAEGPDAGRVRLLAGFRSLSFADVWRRTIAFASGLAHEGVAGPGTFVGICGFGSVDWVVADLASLYVAAVSVPLQTSMSAPELRQVVGEAELSCIVCSAEQLDAIFALLPQCSSVRSVVVMDVREGDRALEAKIAHYERLDRGAVSLHRIADIEALGREKGTVPMVLPSARNEDDPLMSLVYTSGSTGTPKGAMIPESLFHRQWGAGSWVPLFDLVSAVPQVTVNYMPLNHSAGRWTVMLSIARGGEISFIAKSDMSTLFEDIQLARPTTLFLVPRVAEMIHQRYRAEVARRSSHAADESERERIAAAVESEMRDTFLGDRMVFATLGSAPTPPEVLSFLKRCFQIPIFDGYGSTEAGRLTFENRVERGVEWRLVDAPELGYRTTDKPYPRGELHVKTPLLVPGYYKNEQATKALFDDEGFMNTGDIVEQRGPDCLVWLDRARNILKLSQGEFVATSRLEALYGSRSRFIRQVFVYGSAMRSYLLAVIVPDVDAASAHLRAGGLEPDDAALKNLIRSELHGIAREEQLHGYEVPRDFLLEREPFTVERGLLTASNKPARAKLRAHYGPRLEALYAELERAQVEELHDLRSRGGTTISERVKKAISATIGIADVDVGSGQSFIQLGGDSLAAVGLETLLHDVSGVRVPVGLLLDPTSTVQAIVDYIEHAIAGKRRAVTFDDVHGSGAKVVRVDDLRIERFLGADEIESAQSATPRSEVPLRARVALLTGANGFLGRFLALELLEQLEGEGGRLYAIVRAPNDEVALDRLVRVYQTDPELAARFAKASANARLAVLAGDLMKPRFGLSDAVYARLEDEADLIVHNGALVNHALGYAQLFEPNVLGTVEVLRLALAGRAKSIAYVSTLGLLATLERQQPVREDDDVRTFFAERPTEEGYAAGYGTTKWVSEVLLLDAHEKLGVPVTVFRPSEIMAHRRYSGQVNVPDFFTRLVAGIVYTGIAPKSFYVEGAPERAKHYDGLPVDVVARIIAAPAVHRLRVKDAPTYETFHVHNPHDDDGISLDVIVAWVRSGGYCIERISDYDAWYRTFHDRLAALTEPRRHYSPLAILGAWAHPQAEEPRFRDNPLLRERLRAISPELAVLPHVSEGLIHKYTDDLVRLRVIEPPAGVTKSAAG